MKIPKRIRNHVNPFSYRKEIEFTNFNNDKDINIDIGSYRGEFGEKLINIFKRRKKLYFFLK